MKKVSIEDFTQYELAQLDLQCGPANCWIGWLVPELWFKKDCQCHDIDYAAGHTETDRHLADQRFLKNMRKSVRVKLGWWRRWYGYAMANLYFNAVMQNGKKSFNYGNRYATKIEIMQILRKR